MPLDTLVQGMIVGFSIAAPVGPIGILCIKRTLQYGRRSGLMSGLGAASAGVFYGAIAAFGLSSISDYLISCQVWVGRIGGAFLAYLGFRIFFSKGLHSSHTLDKQSLIGDFFSTFILTLVNPMTIIGFLTVFAALGLGGEESNYAMATSMIWGVFLGAMVWWVILSNIVALFRSRINQVALGWINRVAGFIILGFAIYFLFFL